MWNFSKVLVTALVCFGSWLLAVDRADGDGSNWLVGPAASVGSSSSRGADLWEVQVGPQTWLGAQFGRRGNLLLVLTRDGQLQRVELDDHTQFRKLDASFQAATHRKVALMLQGEFGRRFSIHRTAHYIICHDTNESFARQTGQWAEQLYDNFLSYFGSRGIRLNKPRFPMVMVAFDTEKEFREYIRRQSVAITLTQVTGYYSMDSNRIVMFNAFGGSRGGSGSVASTWQNLSTVVHEGAHQIAFNTGCLQRFSNCPLWLVEGIATYFETPKLQGQKLQWKSGRVNLPRLIRFRDYRNKRRESGSLESLLSSDERFRSDGLASDAYAECWALTHFLLNTRSGHFSRYLKKLSLREPLLSYAPEQRLEDFKGVFGRNLAVLEVTWLRYMEQLKGPMRSAR